MSWSEQRGRFVISQLPLDLHGSLIVAWRSIIRAAYSIYFSIYKMSVHTQGFSPFTKKIHVTLSLFNFLTMASQSSSSLSGDDWEVALPLTMCWISVLRRSLRPSKKRWLCCSPRMSPCISTTLLAVRTLPNSRLDLNIYHLAFLVGFVILMPLMRDILLCFGVAPYWLTLNG